MSAPLLGLSDQLVATTRTRGLRAAPGRPADGRSPGRPRSGSRSARGARARARGAPRGCSATGARSRRRARVDLDDPPVGAVVEAAVDADRPVDAVHHPQPARAKRRSRAKSKLNELKRQPACRPRSGSSRRRARAARARRRARAGTGYRRRRRRRGTRGRRRDRRGRGA